MSSAPVISVLIPTYNYARYLPETLESVLNQDFENFEVIIADDASSDNTTDVCERYADSDARITFTRHSENIGMVENWNWCLHKARGTYIKYVLADDKLNHPYAFKKMAKALDAHPNASIVASARSIINEASEETQVVRRLGGQDQVFDNDWVISRFLDRDAKHINSIGEPSAVMFRSALGMRGFDLSYRQLVDLEMWLHLLQQGDLVYLSEPLCCFRRHDQQQTSVNQEDCIHQVEEVELCMRYSHSSAVKKVLFHKMYRMAKVDRPEYRDIVKRIRKEFSSAEYARCYMSYKASRPLVNARRSLAKRLRPDGEEGGGPL